MAYRFNAQAEQRLVQLYAEGVPYDAIAKAIGCSKGAIHRVLKRREIAKDRSGKLLPSSYAEVMKSLASGMTVAQTAFKFGVCDENIRAVKRYFGGIVPRLSQDSRRRMDLNDRMEIAI